MKLWLIKFGKLDACIRPYFANSVTYTNTHIQTCTNTHISKGGKRLTIFIHICKNTDDCFLLFYNLEVQPYYDCTVHVQTMIVCACTYLIMVHCTKGNIM